MQVGMTSFRLITETHILYFVRIADFLQEVCYTQAAHHPPVV